MMENSQVVQEKEIQFLKAVSLDVLISCILIVFDIHNW